jgi:hypothetical protein
VSGTNKFDLERQPYLNPCYDDKVANYYKFKEEKQLEKVEVISENRQGLDIDYIKSIL